MNKAQRQALGFVEDWFEAQGWQPFDYQRETWRRFLKGESGLIHAPTGMGKTMAAWLGPVAQWLAAHPEPDAWPDASETPLQVLWVTPLRALAADTEQSLREPIEAFAMPWTIERRTGDVSSSVRNRQRKRLPAGLVTTPESLSLLLTREDAHERFSSLRAVIVDEWHELLGSKRGTQVQLALARLRTWEPRLSIWGVSATLGNLEQAAQALVPANHGMPPALVQGVAHKKIQIDALIPESMDRFPWAGHLGLNMRGLLIDALEQSGTCLVFTNTRSQCEAWYRAILEARPDWEPLIGLHHGSIDAEARRAAEQGLADGTLKAVIATSSLDLGIDFHPVDRVFQVGSPKGVARLLQRAGRSGHKPGAESRVTCVPTHALELIEVAAARDAATRGAIENRLMPQRPLDVLVQHLVTAALGGGFTADDLYEEIAGCKAYADLTREHWQWVIDFVVNGGQTLTAYPEYKRVVHENGRYTVNDKAIAKRHRMSVGTICGDAALSVKYVRGPRLGHIEEQFISKLKPGDTFLFGGKALELVRVRDMHAEVRKARSTKGALPRWMGGRMPLSSELADAVRHKLAQAAEGIFDCPEMRAVRPLLEVQAEWSVIPRPAELLCERFKTRYGHHLVLYPFAGRLVHEGLAALIAYRIGRHTPATFSYGMNDYGFELTSAKPAPFDPALAGELFSLDNLDADIAAGLNTGELAKRHFREIARIAGLVFQGYPGQAKSLKNIQASSSLFYDVFKQYDPENMLLAQAYAETLELQLERTRLEATLRRMQHDTLVIREVQHPTPLAFPLVVDQIRGKLSTESLTERVARMQLTLEKAAS